MSNPSKDTGRVLLAGKSDKVRFPLAIISIEITSRAQNNNFSLQGELLTLLPSTWHLLPLTRLALAFPKELQ